jgi:hypothetical protein
MIVKKTNSRELVRAVGEGYVEVAERHFGKYTDRKTYGMRLEGGVLSIWIEDGRRRTLRAVPLADEALGTVREMLMRVETFRQFGRLFYELRDRLCVDGEGRGHIC